MDQQEYIFLLEVLDMHFTFISLSISYVSLPITLQVEPECQQHLQVELSSSKSMEGISLPLVWRVKAKSSSSFIPSLESIDILFFRFKRLGKKGISCKYRIYSINRPGRLLNFWTLRVGAYSRWALIKFSPFSANVVVYFATKQYMLITKSEDVTKQGLCTMLP